MNTDAYVRKELPGTLKKLRGHALNMAGEQDADDILQATALKALLNAHQFTPGTSLQAWLYTIMRNEFAETKRGVKNQPKAHIDGVSEHFVARPSNQETIVMLRQVVAAVGRLKPAFQDAIAASLADDDMHTRASWPGVRRSRLYHARVALKGLIS